MVVTKKAAPGKGGQSLVKWDAKFAELAKRSTKIASNLGTTSNMIKLSSGVLQYQGAPVPDNNMDVVVVDHVLLNMFYEDDYDSDNPATPVCFAFGEVAKDMHPHEDSPKPQDSGEGCKDCPQNEWGTAKRGKGKACKNSVRLALISSGDLGEIANAEVAFMHVPVTSTKLWGAYVKNLDETHHRPPLGAIVNISVVPDKDTQFKVVFKLVQLVEDGEQIGALFELYEKVNKDIVFPFTPIEAKPAAAPKNRKFSGGKKK